MGLDKVVSNIRAEGKAQADATLSAARKEADAILQDARRQADELRARRTAEANSAVEALIRREVANADLEARRLKLTAERDLMTQVRAEVEKRVAALPPNVREVHLVTLVQRANVPNGRVWVAKQDEPLARRASIQVAGTFDGLGGVVVASPDGSTRENLRYETLLEEVWTSSLGEVAQKLMRP